MELPNEHRIMSISTNRPDGWPQTTVVGYVNDGFLLYCLVPRNSQKYANVLRDPRVSIAIGSDVADPRNIKRLSLAGRASVVTHPGEFDYVSALRLITFSERDLDVHIETLRHHWMNNRQPNNSVSA
jgi:hypothetical protein